ncbi:MAG: hypothetical protein WBQ23_15890 [Bacteroidota bacterium]
MKILFFFIALAISAAPLLAQEKPQSKNAGDGKQAEPRQQSTQPEFVDSDGDGIDDNLRKDEQTQEPTSGSGRQLRQQRRDRFIDHDGDGISDDRCSGTGLRQGRRRGAAKGGVQ